ncbi:MAG: hypothetical protein U0528_12370 [Anaerolineae bacterium]
MFFRRLWTASFVVLLFFAVTVIFVLQNTPRRPLTPIRNPLPTPEYIADLYPPPESVILSNNKLCFSLFDGIPLTSKVNTGKYLFENSMLSIDGVIVNTSPAVQYNWETYYTRYDEQGELYVVGGPLQTCYGIPLESGIHVAQLKITSMSGRLYSYWWTFEIPALEPASYEAARTATQMVIEATKAAQHEFATYVAARIMARRGTPVGNSVMAMSDE